MIGLHARQPSTKQQLQKLLNSGEDLKIKKKIVEEDIHIELSAHFWRLDIIPEIKHRYHKEKYALLIEKYDLASCAYSAILDLRLEFNELNEMLDYLEQNKFFKKSELVANKEKTKKKQKAKKRQGSSRKQR